jgi:hypothetical protein
MAGTSRDQAFGFKFFRLQGDEIAQGDAMEIVIGKIFFLISSIWAVIVLYRIAAGLLAHRRRD